MKIKTADLIGPALDWAVAQCESVEVEYINDGITRCLLRVSPFTGMYRPSVDWSQGGPIIERKGGTLWSTDAMWWRCKARYDFANDTEGAVIAGPTPLVAAMRCYVASRLGDEVDIPEELV